MKLFKTVLELIVRKLMGVALITRIQAIKALAGSTRPTIAWVVGNSDAERVPRVRQKINALERLYVRYR